MDEIIAPDAIEHEEAPGLEGPTPEVFKQFVIIFRTAFPDLQATTEDMIAEGDKVVARITFTGTHQGDLMDIPATGRSIKVNAIDIVRFADGKIREHGGVVDNLGMLQQLGVLSAPGQGG